MYYRIEIKQGSQYEGICTDEAYARELGLPWKMCDLGLETPLDGQKYSGGVYWFTEFGWRRIGIVLYRFLKDHSERSFRIRKVTRLNTQRLYTDPKQVAVDRLYKPAYERISYVRGRAPGAQGKLTAADSPE